MSSLKTEPQIKTQNLPPLIIFNDSLSISLSSHKHFQFFNYCISTFHSIFVS